MTINKTDIKIELAPGKSGLISFPGINAESTQKTSELLQRNNIEHHGFFRSLGFINHITHNLLGSYDFGATPNSLTSIYERGKRVQRPRPEVDQRALTDLSDESAWDKYLGDNSHYSDFLVFFQNEMKEIGWQEMINKRLFSRTEAANKFLVRFFAPLYHPVIHVGYGLEFGLPGLIPEGLAQAAGSTDWPSEFLLKSEIEAEATKAPGAGKSLRALLGDIHSNEKIRDSTPEMGSTPYESILAKAQDDLISYAKQYRVPVEQIDEKTVESINISALLVGGAVRKDKQVKLDFFLIHGLTASIFLTTFMSQDWITLENKARFLEWKVRSDLLFYAAIGAPPLLIEEIKNYAPKGSQTGFGNPWLDIIERSLRKEDDGHTIKTIRALVNGERVSIKHRDVVERMNLPVVGDMWLKIAAMCIDSVEGTDETPSMWIRGAGHDKAWEGIGPRKTYSELRL